MKIKKVRLINFRGYTDQTIDFSKFTTFVGVNDAGKSTIFEALDIFFENERIETNDININSEEKNIEIVLTFDGLPQKIKLEDVDTTFSDEYLLNVDGDLEIKKIYSGTTLKATEYIVANFPTDEKVQNIHNLKIKELKEKFKDSINDIDKRVSSQIRKVALKAAVDKGRELKEIDIPLAGKEAMKDISKSVHSIIPIYQLFKSDRSNTDNDSEIQDPIKAMVKATIAESESIRNKLDEVFSDVVRSVDETTDRTLSMLKEMDPNLAREMTADFQQPKWDSIFRSFSLDTDSNIPLNKRGSGVRRLILLNFFRAEARRKIENAQKENNTEITIIYAFEEPETAQHPKFQQMLIDSFTEMTELNSVQVMITTHSPSIAKIVPQNGMRLVKKDSIKGATVFSGERAIEEVVNELGIISDIKLYPDQIRKAILVEGPADVTFFNNMYNQISAKSIAEKNTVIFISGGGTTIGDVLNEKFVNQLNLEQVIVVVDGDNGGRKAIFKIKNQEIKNVKPIQLKKPTLEFYLPYNVIKDTFDDNNQINFSRSLEEWEHPNDGMKLNRGQKKFLKQTNIFGTIKANELLKDDYDEISNIVRTIDS